MNQTHYLFKHTYTNKKRWEANWRGYYNKQNYYQFFNCSLYNTSKVVYPFATKGISMRLRVPGDRDEVNYDAGTMDSDNYGNHVAINNAWGLWIDRNKKYHIRKMIAHGDNRYRVIYGGDVRPKQGDVYRDESKQWWGDKEWFIEDSRNKKHTSSYIEKDMIPKGQSRGMFMMCNDPDIRDMWFCGFNLNFHFRAGSVGAGAKRNHSYLISRLTPIPYFTPRYNSQVQAVLGEPTPIDDLIKGNCKIHFWNPPDSYYEWEDDFAYGPPPPDLPEPPDDEIDEGGGDDTNTDPRVPDPFEIPDLTDVLPLVWMSSDWVNITGLGHNVDITATGDGPQIAVADNDNNSKEWHQGEEGTKIGPDQKFMVRMITSDQSLGTVSCTVKVGDGSPVSFKMTTKEIEEPES